MKSGILAAKWFSRPFCSADSRELHGVVGKAAVQTGISDDSVTEITAGVSEGALVITEGQSFLNEGERVTIAK